jgi:hypothetical protein
MVIVRVQEVVDVGPVAVVLLVELAAVDYAEVLLVTVQRQRLVLAVHAVLVVLLREAVLVVPDGVPGRVANEELDEAVVELELPERLSRLVGAAILELLGVRHFNGTILGEIRVIVLCIEVAVIVRIEELVRVCIPTFVVVVVILSLP